MVIQFKEQQVLDYIIPAFTLSEREIVIIKIPGGQPFFDMIAAMNKLLIRKNASDAPFTYVNHIKHQSIFECLFPMTIGKWLNKYANKANPVYKNIFEELSWLTPKTKINSLAGTHRRLLSIYTTLSWTNNIALDLAGIDPEGGKRIYTLIKKIAANGGAVILYDRCDEFKDNCTLYIEARHTTTDN